MQVLRKGIDECLTGKVLVYAKFTGDSARKFTQSPFFSHIASAHDPRGYSFFQNGSVLAELNQSLNFTPNVRQEFPFTIYISPLSPMEEKLLFTVNADVLYAGEFSHSALCVRSLQLGIAQYFVDFHGQLLKRHEHQLSQTFPEEDATEKEVRKAPAGSVGSYILQINSKFSDLHFSCPK